MRQISSILLFAALIITCSCSQQNKKPKNSNAEEILGKSEYLAISYGGFREKSRDSLPTVDELIEDMKFISAMGVKILRTYNTQQYDHASNLLKAIRQLKDEDPEFEMYVMLGAWIDCEEAWTSAPNHEKGDTVNNSAEINMAVKLTNQYPDIVKIIAVGNEAMVHWAASYFVSPGVILKWVNYLQELKKVGNLPSETWITSSDNFASWGGGDESYHTEDLTSLMKAVDYISLHTYPFHDSHYNPSFWKVPESESKLTKKEKIDEAMLRAREYAMSQYQKAADYMHSVGVNKPIHIGETGWASVSGSSYGPNGSKAADEYKQKLYYEHMRDWSTEAGMSCFYFEAFDEQWKDSLNPMGSENHFGLINLQGQAKYALWNMVDDGIFDGLTRDGRSLTKTFNGNEEELFSSIFSPPSISEKGLSEISAINPD